MGCSASQPLSVRWVLELKGQAQRNLSLRTNELSLRPGLSVQLGDLCSPVATLFAQYELWLKPYALLSEPLSTWAAWESWVYAGALFHLGGGLSLGASIAWRKATWRESAAWRAAWVTAPYRASYDALVPALTLVQRVSL